MTEKPTFEQGPTSFVTFHLARAQNLLNAQAAHALRAHSDLSLSEWRVLSLVCVAGETTAASVSRTAKMDKGQVSRSQKSLVKRNYLASRESPQDHRQSILSPTQKGHQTYWRLVHIMRRRQQLLISDVSPDELDRFLATLAKIEARARETVT